MAAVSAFIGCFVAGSSEKVVHSVVDRDYELKTFNGV